MDILAAYARIIDIFRFFGRLCEDNGHPALRIKHVRLQNKPFSVDGDDGRSNQNILTSHLVF
jgi:hypothetical protein